MGVISIDKLKGWRLRKGWTLQAMAEEMALSGYKISKAALGQFEKGVTSPKASTLRAITTVFCIRPSELFATDFSLKFIGFRSLASLSTTHRDRIKSLMSWSAERRDSLCSISGFQRKDWSLGRYKVEVTEQADEIALQVRIEWDLGLDAISGLADVIERNGAEVLELHENPKFSGLSASSSKGTPYLAIQRREQDGARQRMDLAHELAHLVFDTDSSVDEEKFAHRFAGAFLLPREVVISELGAKRRDLNLQELKALKVKYGVSVQAWCRRAKDCGVISDSTYKGLSIRISKAGMRSDEGYPYVKPEAIDRDLRLAARCVTERVLTMSEAAKLAGIDIKDIDDREMVKQELLVTNMRSLTREQRRELARNGAEMTAVSYRENPQDLVPDVVDLFEDSL
jgi:Zn-dependent peptidase ImmA (M78 family)/DNA-binding XRE family transcriptional regulator